MEAADSMLNFAGEAMKVSIDGADKVLRVTGTAAKNLIVFLYTVFKNRTPSPGEKSVKKMVGTGENIKVCSLKLEDLPAFAKTAKKCGMTYAVALRSNDSGLAELFIREAELDRYNAVVDHLQLNTVGEISSQNAPVIASPEQEAQAEVSVPLEMSDADDVNVFLSDMVTPQNSSIPSRQAPASDVIPVYSGVWNETTDFDALVQEMLQEKTSPEAPERREPVNPTQGGFPSSDEPQKFSQSSTTSPTTPVPIINGKPMTKEKTTPDDVIMAAGSSFQKSGADRFSVLNRAKEIDRTLQQAKEAKALVKEVLPGKAAEKLEIGG